MLHGLGLVGLEMKISNSHSDSHAIKKKSILDELSSARKYNINNNISSRRRFFMMKMEHSYQREMKCSGHFPIVTFLGGRRKGKCLRLNEKKRFSQKRQRRIFSLRYFHSTPSWIIAPPTGRRNLFASRLTKAEEYPWQWQLKDVRKTFRRDNNISFIQGKYSPLVEEEKGRENLTNPQKKKFFYSEKNSRLLKFATRQSMMQKKEKKALKALSERKRRC